MVRRSASTVPTSCAPVWAWKARCTGGRVTLVGLADFERTNASSRFVGVIPGFNVFDFGSRSRFFNANLNFYADDNWRISIGHRFTAGIHAGAVGTEYLFRSGGGTAMSAFLEGRAGQNRYAAVWGGFRVYFGAKDKTLIRRLRRGLVIAGPATRPDAT